MADMNELTPWSRVTFLWTARVPPPRRPRRRPRGAPPAAPGGESALALCFGCSAPSRRGRGALALDVGSQRSQDGTDADPDRVLPRLRLQGPGGQVGRCDQATDGRRGDARA